MSSLVINNQKVIDGVIATPGTNTNTWYCRNSDDSFTINGAFNGGESIFDWIVTRTNNSNYIKSGVVKIASTTKRTIPICFETGFPTADYFVFFMGNNNIALNLVEKKVNRFVINASWYLGSEITWIAIHKEFAKKTGINKPGTIFAGKRTFSSTVVPDMYDDNAQIIQSLSLTNNSHSNLSSWYHNEYIIQPTNLLDGIQQLPNLSDYSVILAPSTPINIFWCSKAPDRFKIACSQARSCSIDYLMIQKGVDFWKEF